MMKPKAFVLYPNQWEPLSCLSDEQLGRLFRHIFTWLNDGSLDLQKEEQLVESDILLAFRFILTSLAAMGLTFLLNLSIPLSGIPAILVRGVMCVVIMPSLYLLFNLGTEQSRTAIETAKKLLFRR